MTDQPRPRLLFVGGAGNATLAVDVVGTAIREARERGLEVHVTNQEATLAATPSITELADEASAVDFEVRGASAAWAREQVAAGNRFDVVFGVREMAQEAVAEVAAALGRPGNSPKAVHRVRTKDEARAELAAAGFPQPRFLVCSDVAEAYDFLEGSTGPWVVKPRDAMGSEGVTRIAGPDDLAGALEFLPEGSRGAFIVEEFVEGPEYSAEGVFLGGAPHVLALTSKELLPPPNFFETEYVIPAILPDETAREIEAQVVAALTALELGYGQFHVELWWTERGVVLGEIHVRNAGGWIHRMLPHVIPGLEWFGLVYDDALGAPVDLEALRPRRGAAIRFLTPPSGRLVAVEGWDEVLAHPNVIHAELAIAPGAVIEPHRSVGNRVAHILVGADTPEEARDLVRALEESVRFVTEPVEG